MQIERVTVRGYKSIEVLEDFKLGPMNVLIGPNGAGKSNFLSVFQLLAALVKGNLQTFVAKAGGPDALLYGTRKRTDKIDIEIYFRPNRDDVKNGYRITLEPTQDNRLIFTREETWIRGERTSVEGTATSLGVAHAEAKMPEQTRKYNVGYYVSQAMQSWKQYHFHDTSDEARVKQPQKRNDNLVLKPAAENLAPYLAMLKREYREYFERIVRTIQLVAPFFGGFLTREDAREFIEVEWFEKSDPDTPHRAHSLSDGTLRFICLTTLLLQPPHLQPDTIIIDEPELGLHPFAISILAEMLKQVAENTQVLLSTQSVELLNAFDPSSIIVTERNGGATTFQRLNTTELDGWLADYSLGELWQRNILGGRP